jgi:hypothetical protein
MEVCSVQLGIVGLLLLLVAPDVTAIAVPHPQCQSQCGGIDIHFPFGIGDNCSRSPLFNVTCQEVQDDIYKPFLGGVFELLNISLIHGSIRELNPISTYCHNPLLGRMESNISGHDAISSTFRFQMSATSLLSSDATPLASSTTETALATRAGVSQHAKVYQT